MRLLLGWVTQLSKKEKKKLVVPVTKFEATAATFKSTGAKLKVLRAKMKKLKIKRIKLEAPGIKLKIEKMFVMLEKIQAYAQDSEESSSEVCFLLAITRKNL